MDQAAKQSTVDRLAQATNVLVTVSSNPSVDQLAACIALTLFLNKQGKHATAVFSGKVPSTLEFLQPTKTIEKNTDSLRDFIIALDKTKADKLRYKVEDKVVKIFITPYRTSISEKDFDFSQGDFNVDVVLALGVHNREELDRAITAHGRILHDATVISINNNQTGNLGTINWQEPGSSSLCEMLVELAEVIQPDSFDAQMATAFLTGIVAETQRFSNEKTTSRTMSLSAKLMAAGANQQLVASQLQSKSSTKPIKDTITDEQSEAGTLEIEHETEDKKDNKKAAVPTDDLPLPEPVAAAEPASPIGDVRKEDGSDSTDLMTAQSGASGSSPAPSFPSEPPTRGGTLTANTQPEGLSKSVDPLGTSQTGPMLQRPGASTPSDNTLDDKTLANIEDAVIDKDKTLTDIEKTVNSPHASGAPGDQIADLAAQAKSLANERPQPQASIGAQPLGTNLQTPAGSTQNNSLIPPDPGLPPEQTGVNAAPAPPPVPPPMMPPSLPTANDSSTTTPPATPA